MRVRDLGVKQSFLYMRSNGVCLNVLVNRLMKAPLPMEGIGTHIGRLEFTICMSKSLPVEWFAVMLIVQLQMRKYMPMGEFPFAIRIV